MTLGRSWKVWVERSAANWRTRWRGPYGNGQRTFLYKKDADELADWHRRDFQRRDAGLAPLPPPRPQFDFNAFRLAYIHWLDTRRSERTRYLAERALTLWREAVGEGEPDRAKVSACSTWLLERYHPNGARISLRAAKAAFRWGVREGMVAADPFLYFEFPAAVPVARLVSPAELGAVFREVPDVVRRALFFMLFTGLRRSELRAADWAGVTRRGRRWYLTVLKSKTRRSKPETKTLAIHPRALAVMGPPRDSGPVFDVRPGRIEHALRRAVLKLGLGRLRQHDLRHTWATHLLQAAPDLKALMEVGGWASVQAAMIYQHGTPERQNATLALDFKAPAPTGPLKWRWRGAGRREKGKRGQ